MNYTGKLTSQLSAEELREISALFAAVFNRPVSSGQLLAKYIAPSRSYSYHGLALNETGRIAGALSVIPFDYDFFGKKAVFGCAVDLMIDKSYRKELPAMKKMYEAALGAIGSEIDFLYAVPNRNSYLYFRKILGWKEIGTLGYYALPLRASKLSPAFKGFDLFFQGAAALLNVMKWPASGTPHDRPIARCMTPDFMAYRYPEGRYKELHRSGKSAWYSIIRENMAATAYIIDAQPLTAAWLDETLRQIWQKERRAVDLILYVGTRVPRSHALFKVPARFEPRALHLIGTVLNPDRIDERITHIANWQFNLADLDVR